VTGTEGSGTGKYNAILGRLQKFSHLSNTFITVV